MHKLTLLEVAQLLELLSKAGHPLASEAEAELRRRVVGNPLSAAESAANK